MASVNWVQLDSNARPIPLPHEKFLSTLSHVSLALSPSPSPAAPRTALGSVHVSNLRIVFLAAGSHETPTSSQASSSLDIVSLSVPFTHFHDGRFIQPFFGAQRYEATIAPSAGGGLTGPHGMTLTFKEGGGGAFFELVTEMKERAGSSAVGRAQVESLPLYAPPAGPPPPLSPEENPTTGMGNEEMEIAAVVVAAEEREREERHDVGSGEMPPGYAP